jgi:hypothetical protein
MTSRDGPSAAKTEPKVSIAAAAISVARTPLRWAARPINGIETAAPSAHAAMTQAVDPKEACRAEAMVGSATDGAPIATEAGAVTSPRRMPVRRTACRGGASTAANGLMMVPRKRR